MLTYYLPYSSNPRRRDHGGLTLWVKRRGADEVGVNVRGAMAILSKNVEFINMTSCSQRQIKWVTSLAGKPGLVGPI